MRECPKCGAVAQDSENYCRSCGTHLSEPFNTPPVQTGGYTQPSQGLFGEYVPPRVSSKKEFVNLPENASLRKGCNTAAIICFICAGVTLVVMCFVFGSWPSLLDVALLVGLGIGILISQSFGCALALLIYSIIGVLYSLVALGSFGGWLIVVAGVIAVINTSKVRKAWKQYQTYYQGQQPPYAQQYQAPPNQENMNANYNPYTQQYQAPPYQGDMNAPYADEWQCPNCGKVNQGSVDACDCGAVKPRF